MSVLRPLAIIALILLLSTIVACSSSKSPVSPDNLSSSDTIPQSDIIGENGTFNALGLMGAYELIFDPDLNSADLIPKRSSAIGESWVVNGISYFTISPCGDCLKIKGMYGDKSGINVEFELKHPFEKGNDGLPPSASNREDLDIFDVALVVAPLNAAPTEYLLTNATAYDNICVGQDGYTTDLASLTSDDAALPYFLVTDDSIYGISTWNIFDMGCEKSFNAFFSSKSSILRFDLYLTFGYGSSATYLTRFDTKYYNPEFNKKAAWKVDVAPQGFWMDTDNTTPVDIEVRVYDWQIGATVSTAPDFADANPGHVYAASEVANVSLEIPEMITTLQEQTSASSGNGNPTNPLVYDFSVINENLLPAGNYNGLVKVTDERGVGALPPTGDRDFLVHTEDGITLEYLAISEYATYQSFTVNVNTSNAGYCWTRTWGGADYDSSEAVAVDLQGNVFVAGIFYETVGFDTSGGAYQASNGLSDIFLSKFDTNGRWEWTKTWGSATYDHAFSVDTDQYGCVYVTGSFSESVEFNPDGGGLITSQGERDSFLSKFDTNGNWMGTTSWGGTGTEISHDVCVDHNNNVFVAGYFSDSVDFNPSGGDVHTSVGDGDFFISKFTSLGAWLWTKSWGGIEWDYCTAMAVNDLGYAHVVGSFEGTADFDPDGGNPILSNGDRDCFLSVFGPNGVWQSTSTWGGTELDFPYDIALNTTNNIYITGYFEGTGDFDPAGGGPQTSSGQRDVFLTSFDASYNWQWAKIWGGPDYDHGYSVTVDALNNVYVGGRFRGTADFDPGGVHNETSNGDDDVFLSSFDANGNWFWVKTWGGSEMDYCNSMDTDIDGNIYVAGYFRLAVDFDPAGGNVKTSNGDSDAYVSKLSY